MQDILMEIDKLPEGSEFELNQLKSFQKKIKGDRLEIGKQFKKLVVNLQYPAIKVRKNSDNHHVYKKI